MNAETKTCERCGKLCQTVPTTNTTAQVFVRGTAVSGRFCTGCVVVDFLKNFNLGPSNALGPEFFKSFDPEGFRLPHLQAQFARAVVVAARRFGSELTVDEIPWDEIIKNWHLPFPTKRNKKRGTKYDPRDN